MLQTLWREKIRHKLKDMRKRADHNLLEVVGYRRTLKECLANLSASSPSSSSRPVAPMIIMRGNLIPARPQTEDDESIAAHRQRMAQEFVKKTRIKYQ